MARSNSAKTPIILKHRPTRRRARVEALLMEEKINAFGV
jgi:hypothetical protein